MIYQQPSGVTVRYIYMSVTVTHCQFTAEMFFACSRLSGVLFCFGFFFFIIWSKGAECFSELTFLKQEQKRRLGRKRDRKALIGVLPKNILSSHNMRRGLDIKRTTKRKRPSTSSDSFREKKKN